MLLLTHVCRTVRLDAVRELRWQRGRTLLPELRAQLSPSELQYFKSYDKLLGKYMRKGAAGVGMDLTLVSLRLGVLNQDTESGLIIDAESGVEG